jgi:hypothetical protein
MNEEISRILELLEKGIVTAEEAERLIRAAGVAAAAAFAESPQPSAPPVMETLGAEQEARRHSDRAIEDFWDPFSPFANPLPDLGDLSRTIRRIRDRVRRHNTRRFWWNYFRLNRWYEFRREQRRESMSTYERVRFVILGAPAVSDFILQAQTDIHELLDRDRIAWDLFRLGLEEEFGKPVSAELAYSFRTVQSVVDWVDQHTSAETTATDFSEAGVPAEDNEPGTADPESAASTPDSAEESAPSKPSRRKGATETPPDTAGE